MRTVVSVALFLLRSSAVSFSVVLVELARPDAAAAMVQTDSALKNNSQLA
jgi:hypothetical protein